MSRRWLGELVDAWLEGVYFQASHHGEGTACGVLGNCRDVGYGTERILCRLENAVEAMLFGVKSRR